MTRFRRQSERATTTQEVKGAVRSHLELCFAVLVVTLVFNSFGAAPSDQSRDIAAHWSDYWNAISDLEVESEEFQVADPAKPEPLADQPTYKYQFLLGSGGKRAFRGVATYPGGARAGVFNFREDGRKAYVATEFADDPDATETVRIKPQVDTHEDYKGPMSNFMWLWTPGGKPLHRLLSEGGKLGKNR